MAEFKILYESCVGYKVSSVCHFLCFTRVVIDSVRTLFLQTSTGEVQTASVNNCFAWRLGSYLVCICNVTCMALGAIPEALPHL